MKRTNKLVLSVMLIVGVAVVGAAGAQVATMNYGGSAVTWSPLIENEGFTLTVSGGDQYFRSEWKAGQTPSFAVYGNGGEPLADGVYTWELTPVLSRAQFERGEFAPGKTNADGSYARQGGGVQAPVQSGHFRILNGSLVDPSVLEADAGAPVGGSIGGIGGSGGGKGANNAGAVTNQIISGDLVVYNSICVGFDCPSNPSFGADTIRLQENNLRIHFDDTSTAGSFPRTDWRIEANSNLNGGGSYFRVQDASATRNIFTLEANAPNHSLYVDDGGRVGLGTATPVVDLHIKDGDTPTLRLEQDTSSGFAAQTWDVAGNETNFFVRDATNGSTLPFRIQPGTASSTLFLDADDRVGVATTSPDAKLDVNGQLLVNRDNGSPTPLGDFHIFRDGTSTASMVMENSATRWQFNATNTGGGQFEIFNGIGSVTPFKITEGAPGNLMTLSASGVEISGSPVHPPDYVFEPDYDLKAIEAHAEYMWENKHLPAVGPGSSKINLVGHQYGVLEELEVAHVYIAQLNERLEERGEQVDELTTDLARERENTEALEARLAAIETQLAELAKDTP